MAVHNELKKNKLVSVVVAGLLILSFVFFALAYYLKTERGGEGAPIQVTLQSEGETSAALEFSATGLQPSKAAECVWKISAQKAGRYALTFTFGEGQPSALPPFVTVEVLVEGESVATKPLQALLDGEKVRFTREFAESALTITVRYTLSAEATNETQGASADFDIALTAVKVST